MKAVTVLRRARKLIEDPKSWIQGAFIGKRKGVQGYCGLGALATAAGVKVKNGQNLSDGERLPEAYYKAHELLNTASNRFTSGFFASYNDRSDVTHADVLAAFDRAITAAKASVIVK
jgi:hypothetical protein